MGKSKKTRNVTDLRAGGEVAFKYKFLDNYHPEYISGIYGGTTPREEIVLNFFFERSPLPKKQIYKINEDGQLGDVLTKKSEPSDLSVSLIRQVQSGVIMSKKTAVELRNFLNELLDTVEEKEGDK